MKKSVYVLPGDNIGPEIISEGIKVLETVSERFDLDIEVRYGLLGGAALDATGDPCPPATLAVARNSDAVLLGAVGGPKWDDCDREVRPESGLLKIRHELNLFANLRPAVMYPQLVSASSLKPEVIQDLDILIVRELVGGIYFGEPRGFRTLESGEREGFNTYKYSESEIRRVGEIAFEAAMKRGKRLCSVDKSNVLEATILWRKVISEMSADYPLVSLSHMYVDNAAMQLVNEPSQFDVIVTGNMFGDILSDIAAMLTGSIGMLPSASLNETGFGMYEPCHGSAPDIAGKNVANPLATILSVALLLRYSLGAPDAAELIEEAVGRVLDRGLRTGDILTDGTIPATTSEMGSAIMAAIITS
ncbi:MAG: 3-isopropylmalate dehydrogenase [Cellvibrionales bacterium TMED148]|nr:3-isopropylmalate dehydrogenase [Porticoccaceae bacterium]RPG90037.1 MAG: 3-isopropylmalate dehydrogenase [Cellvibrionales bacterium TMED148]